MFQASDRYVLTTGCTPEPESLWWARRSSYFPKRPSYAHPCGVPSAHKGRVKMFGLLAAVAIFLAAGSRPAAAAPQVYRAAKVPYFSIMANDGMTYTPDYLKGNVVLIMFWATWCPYCRHAMPHMNTFADEYSNSEFTLLGICNSKDPTAWHNYIQEHHLQWPQYLDRDARMGHLFGARGVPNFFLIDKDGYLVAHWVGWDDSLTKQVEKLIDHTLAQPRRQ
jgi:thiol-disulfide isomerase/thioredoxin